MRFLPYRSRLAGLILLIAGAVFGYFVLFEGFKPDWLRVPVFAVYSSYIKTTVLGMSQTNLADELAMLFILIGLGIFVFSKEKEEKQGYNDLRLKAMFLAVAIDLALMIFVVLFIFGTGFIQALLLQMFLLPLVYLLVFRILRLMNNPIERKH